MPRSFDQKDIDESIADAKELQTAFDSIETAWLLNDGVGPIQGAIAKRAIKSAQINVPGNRLEK